MYCCEFNCYNFNDTSGGRGDSVRGCGSLSGRGDDRDTYGGKGSGHGGIEVCS